MEKYLHKGIIDALTEAGVTGDISLGKTKMVEHGDVSFACFVLAKEQKANPNQIAQEIAQKIDVSKFEEIEKVEVLGPYVNFYLSIPFIAREVMMAVIKDGKSFGRNNIGNQKKLLVEYPSQNTHKEFHIGHLRNVCIGNALVQLKRKSGYEVLPINYINDFGAHVVKCLWGINHFYNGEVPEQNTQKWLGEVYAKASTHIKDNPELKDEINELQNKLESRDKEIWNLFIKTRDASLDGFKKIHDELKIEHITTLLESDVKDQGQKIVDRLLKEGIAEVGDGGAIIVDLSEYKLDIALARKSSGAGVYLTSDLALATKKFDEFEVDESINITAHEQNFYFKQLFKVLELAGHKKEMSHIGYGFVTLPEGKMSSRSGNVILYEDLRDQVATKLTKETTDRHADWSTQEVENLVSVMTQAVLKFTILKHEASKNIVFDFKEATSFEGYSAAYVLYVVARINSMIDKSQDIDISSLDLSLLSSQQEKDLLLFVSKYESVVLRATQDNNPSIITKYCFDMAQKYNDFYHHHKVLDPQNTDQSNVRLLLSRVVKDVLTDALSLLTIDTVQKM